MVESRPKSLVAQESEPYGHRVLFFERLFPGLIYAQTLAGTAVLLTDYGTFLSQLCLYRLILRGHSTSRSHCIYNSECAFLTELVGLLSDRGGALSHYERGCHWGVFSPMWTWKYGSVHGAFDCHLTH